MFERPENAEPQSLVEDGSLEGLSDLHAHQLAHELAKLLAEGEGQFGSEDATDQIRHLLIVVLRSLHIRDASLYEQRRRVGSTHGDEEEDKSQEHETFVLVENYSQDGVGLGFVLLSHFLEFLEARL